MKKQIIEDCINHRIKGREGARLLKMHPKSFSRLKARYLKEGESALIGKKPGPKAGNHAANRTPEEVEQIVEALAIKHPELGPLPLSEKLEEKRIYLNETTVWRILKRRKVRYTTQYKRWKQDPKLYCLDIPGRELQMDACFPYGRSRRLVGFDAIDDCSRCVHGQLYEGGETDEAAITFVNELINHCPFRIETLRIDNRYGKRFKEHCAKLNIKLIINDAYRPEQNGKIERFHGTLKREFIWKYCKWGDSIEEMNYKYALWLHYYNYQRRHGGFGMNRLTPAQKIVRTLFLSLGNINYQKVTGTMQQNIF